MPRLFISLFVAAAAPTSEGRIVARGFERNLPVIVIDCREATECLLVKLERRQFHKRYLQNRKLCSSYSAALRLARRTPAVQDPRRTQREPQSTWSPLEAWRTTSKSASRRGTHFLGEPTEVTTCETLRLAQILANERSVPETCEDNNAEDHRSRTPVDSPPPKAAC